MKNEGKQGFKIKKCGKVIAEQKELIRITEGQ